MDLRADIEGDLPVQQFNRGWMISNLTREELAAAAVPPDAAASLRMYQQLVGRHREIDTGILRSRMNGATRAVSRYFGTTNIPCAPEGGSQILLDHLLGPLAIAVTGRAGGEAALCGGGGGAPAAVANAAPTTTTAAAAASAAARHCCRFPADAVAPAAAVATQAVAPHPVSTATLLAGVTAPPLPPSLLLWLLRLGRGPSITNVAAAVTAAINCDRYCHHYRCCRRHRSH